jgi:hypothetical protein
MDPKSRLGRTRPWTVDSDRPRWAFRCQPNQLVEQVRAANDSDVIQPVLVRKSLARTGETTPFEFEESSARGGQPLGVFGLIQEDEKTAQRIFQLAVNKDGVVRGNYYDAVADNTLPVVGSVDKKSQRVAWSIGEKMDIVFETGLSNFTKDDSTVLVHYGKESTQQMILVRLEEPLAVK